MAAKAEVHRSAVEAQTPRVAEIPFEPEHRFAATLHRAGGALHVAVKGAGERVLAMCSHMATPAGDVAIDVALLERQADSLAQAGFRVLAIAGGPVDLGTRALDDFSPADLSRLVFLGFVGMIDPLRPEAKRSVLACRAAGIEVAMVTGDHPVTALAIARELGLADRPEQVVTGPVMDKVMTRGDDAIDALVRDARVFARVEPNQKLRIVQSLIRLGHFVAVTGDGANDAPALRAAHIGVAMGKRGTDIARESAELILTDDNFASIVAGVEEGRIAYGNVRKVIFLLVSSGAAEVLLFVLSTAAGLPLPLWPVQLLWLNLVTNGIQDVALAFEPGEGGELQRGPRSPREPIFNRLMVERTLVSALVIATVGFFAYRWMLDQGWAVHRAQNGVLLLLVLFENVQAGNSRSETTSLFGLSPLRNRLLFLGTIVAQLVHIAAMYTPGVRDVLHLEAVSLSQWAATLAVALSLFAVAEAHKMILRRRAAAS
jgi:magnesium-transporting ATPase (P-type)